MLVSKNIEELTPYQPGKPIKEVERELGISNTIKLASNENPLGASPKATAAVRTMLEAANRYPEGGCYYLRQKLAKILDLQEEHLVFGNGSNEIIELVIRTFILPGEEILFFDPSFVVYPIIAQAADRDFRAVPLRAGTFEMNIDDMLATIGPKTKALFITTPNNPVGSYIPHAELVRLIELTPPNVLICVDEAYIEYSTMDDCRTVIDLVPSYDNLLVMRTFSKAYGLSGYRIGYSAGAKTLVNYLNKTRQPFNVNLLAQTAAEAALDDDDFLSASAENNSQGMQRIIDCASVLGLDFVPSQANFILLNTKGPGKPIFDALLREGVIVRHIPHPMITNYIRVTIGTPEENRIFLEKFAIVLEQEGRLKA